MVIYPFISEQKDFGYSDVTLGNMEYPGKIREFFTRTNAKFKMIRTIQELSVLEYCIQLAFYQISSTSRHQEASRAHSLPTPLSN